MYSLQTPPGPTVCINNRQVDYFCGFSYYSLQSHPSLIEAATVAMQHYGINAGTSRAGYGNLPIFQEVEQKAADFFAQESALYYVSGYLGSALLLQGLAPDYDIIFADQESHYSILDGIAMANKPLITFAHRDNDDLAQQLKTHLKSGQRPLVISDGVFPTSGQLAPLADYDKLLANYPESILCVDDAHAYAVIGDHGRGTLEYFGIQGPRRYSCGTLSKAVGGHGGIITGSTALIEQLKHLCKSLIGSSPVPVPAAAATAAGLDILKQQPAMRQQLWDNVAYAKRAFRGLGFENIPETPVPIICLSNDDVDLSGVQQTLFEQGIVVQYSPGGSYTSVPPQGAIRIAIFSGHTKQQVDRLSAAIQRLI
jgi:glycine C-acetyltransferase/8-amino-7-oxononanoate synthase